MLKILDRYVIRTFLFSYLACMFSFVALYIVVDAFANIDEYIEFGADKMFDFMFEYYACHIPGMFQTISPGITLMAAMFGITLLARRNELIPMRAAGIGVHRLLLPIFFIAFAGSLAMWVNQEYVLPALSSKVAQLKIDKKKANRELVDRAFKKDGFRSFLYAGLYNTRYRIMDRILYKKYYDDGKEMAQVWARQCFWRKVDLSQDGVRELILFDTDPATYKDMRKGKWREKPEYEWTLYDGRVKVWDRNGDIIEEQLAVFTGKTDFRILPTNLTPEDIGRASSIEDVDNITLQELIARIKHAPEKPRLRVRLHTKFTMPLANVLLLMLGLPFVFTRENRSILVGVGIALMICIAFFFVNQVCIHLGEEAWLPPYLAAWLPIILFGSFSVYLFDCVKT